jgi:hypothetical protein
LFSISFERQVFQHPRDFAPIKSPWLVILRTALNPRVTLV